MTLKKTWEINKMIKSNLSICVPSNRGLKDSKESISSAIGFCEATNSELIVSDNSNDENKIDLWNNLSLPYFKFLSNNENENWIENWLSGIQNSNSNFTGIVSDDDLIVNLSDSKFSYNDLEKDVIAVKPIISLWKPEDGIYKLNNYNIDAQNSIDRILQYLKLNAGNNSTFFSFFRTNYLKEIYTLIESHPTKGGYLDWAITLTFIASGKIIVDNSKLLVYKNTNWQGDQSFINNKVEELFKNSGLSEDSYKFEFIFRALDCFILNMRQNSNLENKEKLEVSIFLLELNIKFFEEYFVQNLSIFSNKEKKQIKEFKNVVILKDKLNICLELISDSMPNIEEKYKKFYSKSLHRNWGSTF